MVAKSEGNMENFVKVAGFEIAPPAEYSQVDFRDPQVYYDAERKVFDMTKDSLNTYYDELGATLGETLLAPTRIYVKALRAIKDAGVTVKACSHITGGGFYENIPRMLKDNTVAVVQKDSYTVPPIFDLMAKKGNIDEQMMYNTFNMILKSVGNSAAPLVILISSTVLNLGLDILFIAVFRMGVVGMSKTMAREFGPYNIMVNTMGPGRIYTDRIKYLNTIRAEKAGITLEEYNTRDAASFPQKRYQTADEYARSVVFICSPANSAISGQVICVDGAMTTAY